MGTQAQTAVSLLRASSGCRSSYTVHRAALRSASYAWRTCTMMMQSGTAIEAVAVFCTWFAYKLGTASKFLLQPTAPQQQSLQGALLFLQASVSDLHLTACCCECCSSASKPKHPFYDKHATETTVIWQEQEMLACCIYRAKPDDSAKASWGCPKCRTGYMPSEVPSEYRCFCGKQKDPPADPWLAPHTCGDICGKALPSGCGHTCVLLCHPGPCPPCPRQVGAPRRPICHAM